MVKFMALPSWIKKIKKAWAFSIAVAVHVLLLLIFGSYVLFKGSVPRMPFTSQEVPAGEEISDAPPSEAPPEDPSETMSATEVTETTTTEPLETDLIATSSSLAPPPPMPASLPQPPAAAGATSGKMPSFGGGGGGRGGGKGSAVNFFGVRGEGRNVYFVIDLSDSMLEQRRGGPAAFSRIKAEVKKMIQSLDPETNFNIVCFAASGADLFAAQSVPATDSQKKAAGEFIDKYNNSLETRGVKLNNGRGNFSPRIPTIGRVDSSAATRLDLGLLAAFEGFADTVFLISDGKAPKTYAELSEEAKKQMAGAEIDDADKERYQRQVADWRKEYEAYTEEIKRYREKYKDLLAKKAAREREVREKGIGKKVIEGQGVVYEQVKIPGLPPEPRPPEAPKPPAKKADGRAVATVGKEMKEDDIIARIREIAAEYYKKNGVSPPSIHTVGYMSEENERKFLERLARRNNGNYRQISAPLPKDDAG